MYIRPVQYSSWWFSPRWKASSSGTSKVRSLPMSSYCSLEFPGPGVPRNVQGFGFCVQKNWGYESSPTDTCFSDVKQISQAMGPFPNPATSDTRWDVRSLGWFVFFVAGRFGKILRQCSEQNTIKPCTRTQRTNQLSPMGLGWLWNESL